MSLQAGTIARERAFGVGQLPAWAWLGIGVYALLLVNGSGLLRDSDTYWQILVGQWILDHHALPHVDIYSFTKAGEPWMSSSWLAQVLYALSYNLARWNGPVVLAAGSAAATFALLAHILGRRIPQTYAVAIALGALVLSMDHLLARPHVLTMPVMLVWASALLSASERGEAPPWWLLPLIALWTNLHGGFLFGLVLVAAFALDAVWSADPSQRRSLALRWAGFGAGAVAACCATPYGWGSILAARKILDLGELLRLIYEWMPADFSRLGAFEICILMLLAGLLHTGVKLTPPRIALVLGLLHMALTHVRNLDIFALLLPLVAMSPVAARFALQPNRPLSPAISRGLVVAMIAMLGISSWAFAASRRLAPPEAQSPAAAVDALKALGATRSPQ